MNMPIYDPAIEYTADITSTVKYEVYTNNKGVKMCRFLAFSGDMVTIPYAAFTKYFKIKGV